MLKNLLNRILSAPAAAPAASATAAPAPPTASVPAPAPVATPAAGDVARADALIAEGNALEDAGDLARAEARYRDAVEAAPGHARAHLNLGIVLAASDDAEGAIAAYETVLAIEPAHPFGNYNYARLALLRGDTAKAETLVAAALRAKPDFPQALIVQSSVLEALGKSRQAIAALRTALALQPEDAGGWSSLASMLDGVGDTEEAIAAIRAALRLQPQDAGSWFNLASMLHKTARPDEAEEALARALEDEPGNLAGLELSVGILRDQGRIEEALVAVRKIIEREATAWRQRSFELMMMNFVEGIPNDELARRHVEFGRDLEAAVPVRFEHRADRGDPQRRLRVGYLSSDLLLHPVSFFLAPVLEHHDRSRVEVFCYSFAGKSDPMTERVRKATDQWRDVTEMADTELADAIHADGIDVLVDLMGHTGLARLAVFCQRPAPVQVGWLGYLNTTGLSRMDFRLCDVRTDPPAISQPFHTERLVALPESQWCYQPIGEIPIDPVAPVERNGHITFGSFNAAAKVTPATCRRWGEILLRLPGSRLLIVDTKSAPKRASVLADITGAGVAADRIEFLNRVPLGEYMGQFNRVDITLDTFPYGGGTTTFDSLWMGVPVVATVGDIPVSRSAASLLTCLGLSEWIAPSIADYVDTAVARASDRTTLATLRRALRPRLAASPLTDIARFTRDLEAAYRTMWLEKTA
jgi:predicted O-linked N-acetylglucosamine transferase (SPINDLY family)